MAKLNRAVTEEQIQQRKDEIISSCYEVYLEKGFIETSIKDISLKLSFARSSIYNYYQTKEEIFLDLLKNEYDKLCEDLEEISLSVNINDEELARKISTAYSARIVLLQIISTTLNELEKYSRIEFLIDFKKSYKNTIELVQYLVEKYTDLTKEKVDKFIELFFPFVFGVCSFTIVSPKQLDAMEKAGMKWVTRTSQQLIYDFIINLLRR